MHGDRSGVIITVPLLQLNNQPVVAKVSQEIHSLRVLIINSMRLRCFLLQKERYARTVRTPTFRKVYNFLLILCAPTQQFGPINENE